MGRAQFHTYTRDGRPSIIRVGVDAACYCIAGAYIVCVEILHTCVFQSIGKREVGINKTIVVRG